jgi:hypothetical protein
MSGQPLRRTGDASVFRQQYLANLGLRAKIDDKNLQANKTYKRTGQLPVELTDYRTLSEKYADIERIKNDMRMKLLTITDGINAQEIISRLDDNTIIFMSQNWSPISDAMKKMYGMGVLADIFIDYLDRYITKFQQNRGVEDNLQQQNMMNDLVFNTQAILSQMPSAGEIRNLNLAIIRGNLFNKRKQEQITQLLNYVVGQNAELEMLVRESEKIENAINKEEIQELISDAFQNLPKKDDIREYMENLVRPIDIENREKMSQIADDIQATFEVAQMNNNDILVIRQLIDEYAGQKTGGAKAEAGGGAGDEMVDVDPADLIQEAQAVVVGENNPNILSVQQINTGTKSQLHPYVTQLKKDAVAYYTGLDDLSPEYAEVKGLYDVLVNNIKKKASDGSATANKMSVADLQALLKNGNTRRLMTIIYGGAVGKGIRGGSVYKTPKRYDVISKSDIDNTKGIKASPKFVPFGRFIIHKNQLDKDIVSIRRPAGSSVGTLPASRVSRKLGGMLRKIIGGGVPSFDELNSLDDEEKAFLHKVAKETRIDDKISIPTPQKDEEDKLINEFEILRGQIVAGNDNAELIKKFRIALVKMGNKGLIPKAQMKELLIDIATL